MALTKIPSELSSTTGIVDNSNATAITIDSNENVGIGTSSPVSNQTMLCSNQALVLGEAIQIALLLTGSTQQIYLKDYT